MFLELRPTLLVFIDPAPSPPPPLGNPTSDPDVDSCAFWWFSQFHTYAAPSEESFYDKWLRADSRVDDLERRLRNALQCQKWTKLTVLSLVEELKEKNMLTEDLQSRLDAYSGRPSINSLDTSMTTKIIFISSIATLLYMIIINKYFRKFCGCICHIVMFYKLCKVGLKCEVPHQFLFCFKDFPIHLFKKTTEYTNEQKDCAMTLHLYGPRAYDYLAKKVYLPSPRTLRR